MTTTIKTILALLALAFTATAHADYEKYLVKEKARIATVLGGEPEQFVPVQRRVSLYFIPMTLAYREHTFSFVNGKEEVRFPFRCDELLAVEIEIGRVWNNVRLQTASEFHILRVINGKGHEADTHKLLDTLKACAAKETTP